MLRFVAVPFDLPSGVVGAVTKDYTTDVAQPLVFGQSEYQVKDTGRESAGRFVSPTHTESQGEGRGVRACELGVGGGR
jgi:hypothetical protein